LSKQIAKFACFLDSFLFEQRRIDQYTRSIMTSWFEKLENPKLKQSRKFVNKVPEGLWVKCPGCSEVVAKSRFDENWEVCPFCGHHQRLDWQKRLEMILDGGVFERFDQEFESTDPLEFIDKKDYKTRIKETQEKTNEKDSVVAGTGKINGHLVSFAVMNFSFMGGSMGVACGEMIARAMDKSYEQKIPCLVISSSGGARMQEGILSLMQMAKTSASRSRLRTSNIPYLSILTHPTTGGCAASFSMLGDLNIAEPNALIGFAGPRVIEQSIKQKLPEGFQRSEFLHEHGFVDRVVHRHKLKAEISFFLEMFAN
jgi:acetyl-CoA carboxylase carboxyl transferase subunit beta